MAQALRLYLHDEMPKWLVVSVSLLALFTLGLYFAAPDVPKLAVIPFLPLALFLLVKSSKASQSWIEVSSDGSTISAIPSWYARILGEAPTIFSVPPGSTLLFCRDVAYGYFDKYCVVLRGPDGTEQTLLADYQGRRLNYLRCSKFSKEMRRQYGLPVLLLNRDLTENGTTESEWIAKPRMVSREAKGLRLATLPLPYLGIVIRVFTANTAYLVASGVALWFAGIALFCVASRLLPNAGEKSDLGRVIVSWSLWFPPWYAATVLVTGALLNR